MNSKAIQKLQAYQQASYYTGVSEKVVVEIACSFEQTGTILSQVKPGNLPSHKTLVVPNAIVPIREFILEFTVLEKLQRTNIFNNY